MVDWEKLKRKYKKRDLLVTLERVVEEIKMENIKNLNIVLLSEKEASKILNVSYNKLRYLRQQGKISFVRVGASIKYRIEYLQSFLERNAVKVEA
jgi:excisionase family DNA binding protein